MRVQRRALPARVVVEAGRVALALHAQGRAGELAPPHDGLLLGEGRAVPEFDEHADDAHGLVGAAHGPPRLAVAGAHPHVALHGRGVAGVEVGGAVLEAHEVAGRARRAAAGGRAARVAVDDPVQHEVAPAPPHELADGELDGVGMARVDGEEHVPVRARRVEPVVGEEGHALQFRGALVRQPVAPVEEGRAHAHGHAQVVGRGLRAEQPRIDGRVGVVARGRGPPRHEPLDLVGEVGERLAQGLAVGGERLEGGHQPEGGHGLRGDARLVLPVEGHVARRGRRCRAAVPAVPIVGGAGGEQRGTECRRAARERARLQEGAPRDPPFAHAAASGPS